MDTFPQASTSLHVRLMVSVHVAVITPLSVYVRVRSAAALQSSARAVGTEWVTAVSAVNVQAAVL